MRHVIRYATEADIPTLIDHHSRMFEEILVSRGQPIVKADFSRMELAYRKKLEKDLTEKICHAWIMEVASNVVSSAALSIASFLPIPTDPTHHVAYVHSVYTTPEFRGQGFAESMMREIIHFCEASHLINRISLNASDAGRPIYEKLGFILSDNTMSLTL